MWSYVLLLHYLFTPVSYIFQGESFDLVQSKFNSILISIINNNLFLFFQLYEISDDPQRKEFLDDLFSFMQKRGKSTSHIIHPLGCGLRSGESGVLVERLWLRTQTLAKSFEDIFEQMLSVNIESIIVVQIEQI